VGAVTLAECIERANMGAETESATQAVAVTPVVTVDRTNPGLTGRPATLLPF
jgi:hypothetical protein